MNSNKHQLKYKKALAAKEELSEQYSIKYNIKSLKLDPPIFWGWKKYFALRDDLRNYKNYEEIKACFEIFGQVEVYCKNKNFIVYVNGVKHELKPGLKKIYHPSHSKFISNDYYNKRIEIINKYQRYISSHIDVNDKNQAMYYTFDKFYLKEVIKPHYLTHYKPVEGEVESNIARLNNKMRNHLYWETLGDLNRYDWENLKDKKLKKIIEKETKETLDNL